MCAARETLYKLSNCHSEARLYRARSLLLCCQKQTPRRYIGSE
jgi:hypothetical protein